MFRIYKKMQYGNLDFRYYKEKTPEFTLELSQNKAVITNWTGWLTISRYEPDSKDCFLRCYRDSDDNIEIMHFMNKSFDLDIGRNKQSQSIQYEEDLVTVGHQYNRRQTEKIEYVFGSKTYVFFIDESACLAESFVNEIYNQFIKLYFE